MTTLVGLLDKLETYNWECEGGPLVLCRDWMALRAAIATAQAEQSASATSAPVEVCDAVNREFLGKLVRMEWVKWAREQPTPKQSWLLPWDELTEPEREVDRRIGESIWKFARHLKKASATSVQEPVAWQWQHLIGNPGVYEPFWTEWAFCTKREYEYALAMPDWQARALCVCEPTPPQGEKK